MQSLTTIRRAEYAHAVIIFSLWISLPALSAGEEAFRFDADIGIAANRSGKACLTIHNSGLAAGERVILVNPFKQTFAEARVRRRATDTCRDKADIDTAPATERYELRLVKGSLPSSGPAIAVFRPRSRLNRRGKDLAGDIDADGEPEYFRSCGSSEGLHLTVWSGSPLKGVLRWHHYYYLGYDIEPTCSDQEMPKER